MTNEERYRAALERIANMPLLHNQASDHTMRAIAREALRGTERTADQPKPALPVEG